MKTKELPSVEYLNEILRVDKLTGELYWKERAVHHFSDGERWAAKDNCKRWNVQNAGKRAGNEAQGYRQVSILKQRYPEHRIVYAMIYGEPASGQLIDHVDGNGLNNAPSNLRVCDHELNAKNSRRYKNNSSGCSGVSWYAGKTFSGWQVRVRDNQKTKCIKYTADFFEACCARKSAENRLGYHANHGRSL